MVIEKISIEEIKAIKQNKQNQIKVQDRMVNSRVLQDVHRGFSAYFMEAI